MTVLAEPRAYAALMRLLGADRGMARLIQDIVRPTAGNKVLDLGCGPGRMRANLTTVDYVGLDIDAAALALARHLQPEGRFERHDVAAGGVRPDLAGRDLVIACGLLHHLDDAAAFRTLEFACQCLRPGGRLITLDCALEPGQPFLAGLLARADRGRFVRDGRGYLDLVRARFPDATLTLHGDLLRVPYTHAIVQARRP